MQENVLAQALYQRFLSCPQYAKLLNRVSHNTVNEVHVIGLHDSAKSLVSSFLQQETKRPFFLISSDNHHAARYQQEISNLTRFPVYLYPASEVSPYEQVLHSPDTIANQMEVLEHIINQGNDPYTVILPVQALVQRVLDRNTLKSNTIFLNVNQSLEIGNLSKQLIALGYKREAIVTLRGEFSIRGNIIDIFPSCGLPIRLELFGDEIESIRIINIDTQRSIGTVDKTVVPPRWWIVPGETETLKNKLRKALDEANQSLSDEAQETLRSVMENDLQNFDMGKYPESAEYYASFVHDTFATIFHYIPNNALLLFDEWDTITMALKSYEQKLTKTYEEGVQSGRLLPLPRPLHMTLEEYSNYSTNYQKIFLESLLTMEESTSNTEQSLNVVKFDCHHIDRFNSQIKQLVLKVRQWTQEGNQIVISTEQPQRVLGLLKEWDCSAIYLASGNKTSSESAASDQISTLGGLTFSDLLLGSNINLDISQDNLHQTDLHNNNVWIVRHGFGGGFKLDDIKLVSVTDAELFGQKRRPTTYRRPVSEKTYERFTAVTDLKVNDYVVHVKHGIGQFIGVQRIAYDDQTREYLSVQYLGDDRLYVPVDQINLLSRYRGSGDSAPRLSRLGGAEWESTKKRVKKSVRKIAEDLTNLYAMRAKQEGYSCLPDTPWQYEMEEAFPYDETPDQWQAIVDTKSDMESNKPMDRLICGDVGFGKTEIAIRSIFKTVMSGKQAAILVPTTILAQQHFNTLADRFAPYPIRVGLLSRFRTAREQKEVLNRLALGECDVVIGTHRLLQKDIIFKDLGLVVIDEEHRFGVAHKEKLKHLRVMVDVLTMSATPIPRTLHMALSGARDMSIINTPPVNRAPIKTHIGEYRPQVVRTAILHELERGGQVYFVHNRVETIEGVAFELKELIPEARIAIGHGQMQERELENVMLAFANHEYDILVCTTIIESGLDIPNANTIIIDSSDRLGLAQLYQLRGRVGRSDVQAYAYCFYRPDKVISETAQNRLKAIKEFTSLGSGYQIALRDMEIRGVGNILGGEQHGHMLAVGFDLYCKILEESVSEIKDQRVIVEPDTQIDINVTAFIPDNYVPDEGHRIIEYKRLADVKSERALVILTEEWRDRFGPIPIEVQQLAQIVKLRLLSSQTGVTAIKPDMVGIRLSVGYRLQHWLPIQAKLPKHLATRTTYKPGASGTIVPTPYILLKTEDLTPPEQLNLIEELLNAMVNYQQSKAS
jgi:transcription-repair coupling factor (superfamily II helicase)